MPLIKDVLHPASFTVGHLLSGIQVLAILRLHTCYALPISRLCKFLDCAEHIFESCILHTQYLHPSHKQNGWNVLHHSCASHTNNLEVLRWLLEEFSHCDQLRNEGFLNQVKQVHARLTTSLYPFPLYPLPLISFLPFFLLVTLSFVLQTETVVQSTHEIDNLFYVFSGV